MKLCRKIYIHIKQNIHQTKMVKKDKKQPLSTEGTMLNGFSLLREVTENPF